MTDQRKGSDAEPTTHFGFKNVPESQKAEKVAEVFHSVAAKYDLMNDLLSGGMHRLWKRFAIELSGVRTGNRVLDIAGGTGDLTKKFSHLVGPTGQVVLADINESMLKVGRDRLLDLGVAGNVEFVQADAEKLPFPDNHFDCVTIAFGLRNVTHKEDALRSMLRVLKPGGRLLVLEFSKPTNALMSKAYDAYSFAFMPLMGKLITNDSESYRYLAESIRMHPNQETLKSMMVEAGFDRVTYHNMTAGIVALHRGIKPLMLLAGLLASVELGLNRVLRLDSTALPRLAHLSGRVIAVDCRSPAFQLFILPSDEGLMLASQWETGADCTLRAPASSLLKLAMSKDKTAVLHGPEVELDGDSGVLLELAAILQDLELDWEYELSRWLGPVATQLVGGHLRSRARWYQQGFVSLGQNLGEYLAEESRTLVGQREAEARFSELDQIKLDLERLEARFERLSRSLDPSDNA